MVLYLLHGLIKPTRTGNSTKASKTPRGKKKNKPLAIIPEVVDPSTSKTKKKVNTNDVTKYGITDSIESMIKIRTNISSTAPKKKLEQPYILCIGEDIYHTRQFYVVMEETKYIATSFLHALEITFKIFNLFNFDYPTESVNVWLFIQKFFFDVHYAAFDFINTDVTSYIGKLSVFEKDIELDADDNEDDM